MTPGEAFDYLLTHPQGQVESNAGSLFRMLDKLMLVRHESGDGWELAQFRDMAGFTFREVGE